MTRPDEVIISALATALHLTYEICEEDPGRADDARQQIAAARAACDALRDRNAKLEAVAEAAVPFLANELDVEEWWTPEHEELQMALRAAGYSPTEGGLK